MSTPSTTTINRRTALARLRSSSFALLALRSDLLNRPAPNQDTTEKSLTPLTEKSRQILRSMQAAPEFTGQISANRVQELLSAEGKSVGRLMVALLPLARAYSRPPISTYRVGAVAGGLSGSLYLGMNVEIPGHSLGFSVHGEQAALSNAYMHAERGVTAIAVTAAPCGHCRQFMNEMSPDGAIEILVEGKPPLTLSKLLPMAFGPRDLGFKEGAFPVRDIGLTQPPASSDGLAHAAWEAASRSYAPYSGAPSGVAISTRSGRVYKGSYIENAAFNPSLSPLQTALVQLVLAGEDYSAISRVALAEKKGAKISQASVTKAVLSALAPSIEVRILDINSL